MTFLPFSILPEHDGPVKTCVMLRKKLGIGQRIRLLLACREGVD
jgi:hypothetical protein